MNMKYRLNQKGIAFLLVMVVLGVAMVAAFVVISMSKSERFAVEGFAAQKRATAAAPGLQQIVRDAWVVEAAQYRSNSSISSGQLEAFRSSVADGVQQKANDVNLAYGGNAGRTILEAEVPGPVAVYHLTQAQRTPAVSGPDLLRSDFPGADLYYAQLEIKVRYYPLSKQVEAGNYMEAVLPVKLWYQGSAPEVPIVAIVEADFLIINNGQGGTDYRSNSLQLMNSGDLRFKRDGTYILRYRRENLPAGDYSALARVSLGTGDNAVGVYYHIDSVQNNGFLFEMDKNSGLFKIMSVVNWYPVGVALISQPITSVAGFNASQVVDMRVSVSGGNHILEVKNAGSDSYFEIFNYRPALTAEGDYIGIYGRKYGQGADFIQIMNAP